MMQAINRVLCSLFFQNEVRHLFCFSRPRLPFRKCTFLLSQGATALLAVVNNTKESTSDSLYHPLSLFTAVGKVILLALAVEDVSSRSLPAHRQHEQRDCDHECED